MLLLLVAAGGCAKATVGFPDAGGGGFDFGEQDLYGVDFAGADFSGVVVDLAGADLTVGPDLAMMCSPFPQAGCGSGEKCTYSSGTSTTCVSAGNKAIGAICGVTGGDDCVSGGICIQETPSVDQCRAFCTGDADCTQAPTAGAPVARCFFTLTGTSSKLCTIPCNPVTRAGASGCGAGVACELFVITVGAGTAQATDCTKLGAGGDAADCTTNGNADCGAGFTCVTVTSGTTTAHRCRQVCRLGMAADCTATAGSACVMPTGTSNTYGFCCPSGTGC